MERRLDLHVEHELVAPRREVLDPGEVGDGGVVDQDVGRPEPLGGLATSRSRSSGLDRSARIATAVPPAARICSTVSPIVPSSGDVPGSVVLAATATAAPAAPNRRAISAPIPRLAPVTIATFPSSSPMPLTLRAWRNES